jgi:hypothetical protein
MLVWACARCGPAYFGTPHEDELCGPGAADDEGTSDVSVPA